VSAPAHEVTGPGGRTLAVYEAGDPSGPPILFHHGTPAHGALFEPWVRDATERGVRLIGYDRPGYGGSTTDEGRTVASAAADVVAILEALGIERFATWGVSGGGPHSLACAALLGDRVVGAASLAGVAPFDADGLNWFAGMGEGNLMEFGAALEGRGPIERMARQQSEAMLGAAGSAETEELASLLSGPDVHAMAHEGFGGFWAGGMAEIFASGVDGWVDDDLAFLRPFGFAVESIAVPTLVFHGRHDMFVPVSHGEWLARRIPGAEVRISVDDGHLTLMTRRIPAVHEWLLSRF
jgi:pimeloyl-ACP methyl ester carboxylesterase